MLIAEVLRIQFNYQQSVSLCVSRKCFSYSSSDKVFLLPFKLKVRQI